MACVLCEKGGSLTEKDSRHQPVQGMGMFVGCRLCSDRAGITLPNLIVIKSKDDVMKSVAALLNTVGDGMVLLHTDPTEKDALVQQYKDDFNKLTPPGCLFEDVFDIYPHRDGGHLVCHVANRPNYSTVITFKFNTKVGTAAGADEITQSQMAKLINDLSDPNFIPTESASERDDTLGNRQEIGGLKLNSEVVMSDGGPFTEHPSREAKDVQRKKLPENRNGQADFDVDFIQNKFEVRQCVSRMSKRRYGGSLFIGFEERKVGQRRKKYFCRGFQNMTRKVCSMVLQEVEHCVCHLMLWVGRSDPKDIVEVIFHRPQDADSDHLVVEIKVKYYPGLCFYMEKGPEAYECDRNGNINEIKLPDWLKRNGAPDDFQKRRPYFLRQLKEKNHCSINPSAHADSSRSNDTAEQL
ncbi:hypothetical protein BaRGS_00032577 [Batillaria attramentaria]|uniref:Uncharacterized protein n=1 Tax=Batillaria attramentaria TaxID=370345 RepID=A0ABD0JM85_9CAEN